MTKKELEKEADEFIDSKKSFWRQGRTCIDSVKQAYITGAEPRERRIKDLEKENAEAKNLIEELASSLSVVGECDEEECELINKAQKFINKPIF